MPWDYQSDYVYKYRGSPEDFSIAFLNAMDKFNQNYPEKTFKITGTIHEDKLEIEIEKKGKTEVFFYSPIQSVNGELRLEGVLKTVIHRPLALSFVYFLLKIILLPFFLIYWIIKKVFIKQKRLSKAGKLKTLMVDYMGCEPSPLLETENQIEDIKKYLLHNEKFSGTIDSVSPTCINIRFHEYLALDIYFESQHEEAYISMNHEQTHWHPMNNEVLDYIKEIVEGGFFFIEIRRLIGFPRLKIVSSETQYKKYLGKKHIRIYNSRIIQRS